MGCDIHGHFEVKIGGKWEHYSTTNIWRDYSLFEKMAGVRGDINKAISPPKGLPDDISIITKLDADRWGIDGHHHSWLSSSEFKVLYNSHKTRVSTDNWWDIVEQYGFLFGQDFESFSPGAESFPKEIEDFRLVFWFDN